MTYPAGAECYTGADATMVWIPNEPTFGADIVAPNAILLDVASGEKVIENVNMIKWPGIRANKMPRKDRHGNRQVSGPLPVVGNLEILGYFFQNMFGEPTAKTGQTPWLGGQITGSGLSDITPGGTHTGDEFAEYLIEIDGEGTPDTFQWSKDGGATWEASTVAVTGAAQTLDDGVTITFGATTGHTDGDQWLVYACAQTGFVFTMSGNRPTWAKVERQWASMSPKRYLPYSGVMISKLGLPIGSEWNGLVNLDILGRVQEDEDTSPLDATSTALTAPWLGASSVAVLKAGQQIYQVEQIDLSFAWRETRPRHVVGGGGAARSISTGMLDVMASITLGYEDATWISQARALTDVDLGIRVNDLAETTNSMDVRMLEGTLKPDEAGISEGDTTLQFEWSAHYENAGLSTMIQIILDNGLASTAYDGP